jgi:hypothetical protein
VSFLQGRRTTCAFNGGFVAGLALVRRFNRSRAQPASKLTQIRSLREE